MNYFNAIIKRADELNQQAQEYLDGLELISNLECIERIDKKAQEIWDEAKKQYGEDVWDHVPSWVADIMDCWFPYTNVPKDGSIYFSLGFSPVALDANLRKLLEHAEGRTENIDPFPLVAEKEIVDQYMR